MQALRAVVIFMAFILVGGIALLVYGVMNDWHKRGGTVETASIAAQEQPVPVDIAQIPSRETVKIDPFGDWEVALPQGAVIRDMEAKEGRLYLRYVSGGRGGVLVLDLATKTHLGTIKFK